MKKLFLSLAVVSMALASCSTVSTTSTSTVMDVPTTLRSASEADLDVSDQVITYSYVPSKEVARGGKDNVISTAVAEALKANGNGDVLVHPNYQVTMKGKKGKGNVLKVVVSGHVGKYKNFHSVKPCCKNK